LSVVRYSHTTVINENWRRSSLFHTYITHEGNSYKLMINKGSCTSIIAKAALDRMGLKAEPHRLPYKVNWVDKTTKSII